MKWGYGDLQQNSVRRRCSLMANNFHSNKCLGKSHHWFNTFHYDYLYNYLDFRKYMETAANQWELQGLSPPCPNFTKNIVYHPKNLAAMIFL